MALLQAGVLRLRAKLAQGRLLDVTVQLERPNISRYLVGQTTQQVQCQVPLLYNLCAQAQKAAAQAACAAATGCVTGSIDNIALWRELLHELLWRLLLDWPSALGLPAAQAAFKQWRSSRNSPALLTQTQNLLSQVLPDLSRHCLAQLKLPSRSRERPAKSPELAHCTPPSDWSQRLATEPVRALDWLTAQPAKSLGEAYLARLDALQDAAKALANAAPYPIFACAQTNCGLAQVHTARGILTHAVQLEAGRVRHYQVCAPTDLFFKDAQALQALLAGAHLGSLEQARQRLALALLALDPCVPYELDLCNA